MAKEGVFTIKTFARYCRTTAETLRHYDRIGLLQPVFINENRYRYYSPAQMAVVNVIRTFQELGIPLDEIKIMLDGRAPDNLFATYSAQMEKLNEKISNLEQTKHLLATIYNNFNEGLKVDEESLAIEYLDSEPIILGDQNDYSRGHDDYDALNIFYERIHDKYPKLNLNYPVWGFFSKERVIARDWKWPDRFYIYHPNGDQERPEGTYAVGYARGGYGECDELYERLLAFIEREGYEVIGGSYEEYILNELFVPDDGQYLIRMLIQVSKKSDSE